MAYRLEFENYTFPESLTYNLVTFRSAVPSAKLPRAHGARVPTGYLGERRIEIRGMLKVDLETPATLQDQIDDLRAALMDGPQTLYLPNSRYLRNVQKDDNGVDRYDNTWPERLAEIAVDLITGDPFMYSDTESSDLTNVVNETPEDVVVNNAAGNAPALPELRLTVGGAGAVTIAVTVSNQTTGEAFTLSGAVSGGDVIKINSLDETVLIGTTDKMSLFDGLFPSLALGNNTIRITYTSGTITNLDVYWRSRWY